MNTATRQQDRDSFPARPVKSRLIVGAEMTSIAAAFLFVGMMVFGVL